MALAENIELAGPEADHEAELRAEARRKRLIAAAVPIGTAIALILIWQAGVRLFEVPTYIAPAPSDIAVTFVDKFQ